MITIDVYVNDGIVAIPLHKAMMIPAIRKQILSPERREIVLSKLVNCSDSERKSIISWLKIQ